MLHNQTYNWKPVAHSHSLLKLLAGLLTAALSACVLTIIKAKTKALNPAKGNIHHAIEIR